MCKMVGILLGLLLTVMANAQSNDEVSGVYDVQLKIGESIFNDVLELQATEDKSQPMIKQAHILNGTMTVPGIFTSALENGHMTCVMWSPGCNLSFEITAKENGKEYKVYYILYYAYAFTYFSEEKIILKGSAYLENNIPLGDVEAVRR